PGRSPTPRPQRVDARAGPGMVVPGQPYGLRPDPAKEVRDGPAKAFRGTLRQQHGLVVPAVAQPRGMQRNGHQQVRFWYPAALEQYRERRREVLAALILEPVDGLGERAAVQVRSGGEGEPGRALAAMRAPARLEGWEQ